MYKHIFLEKAQYEYEESVDWYLQRSNRAAVNFISAIDHTIESICENPLRWRNAYKHYYELGLKKYPFSIIYAIDESSNTVVIISVFHHKRNPRRKYNSTT